MMDLQSEKIVLLDYLEENPPEMLDVDLLRVFHENAQDADHEGGDPEVVYGLGLLIHQLVTDYKMYPEVQQAPAEVLEKSHQQALAIFNKTAAQGVNEGMKMVAWCNLMGLGTDKDPVSARIWFEHAVKNGEDPKEDLLMAAIEENLRRHDATPENQKLSIN